MLHELGHVAHTMRWSVLVALAMGDGGGGPLQAPLEAARSQTETALTYRAGTFHFRLDELGTMERTMREGVEGFLHFLARG